MIVTLIALVTLIILAIPAAILFIPWAMITGNANPLYHGTQAILRIVLAVARIRVQVEGRQCIPAHTACLFMVNHVSNLDPPVLFPYIPGRTSVFLKRSLMKIPVLGYAFKLGDLVPVDRDGNMASALESSSAARAVLAKGLHFTIFVEGTRSTDGRLAAFKKGPFFLAMEAGAPCVPVSIYGTEALMAKGSARIRPGTAHIVFHAPLNPADFASREDLLEAVRVAIASGLPDWMRE